MGDEVLVVDGIPLDGQPLSKVLSSGATTYEFIVYRNDPQLQVIFLTRACWHNLPSYDS